MLHVLFVYQVGRYLRPVALEPSHVVVEHGSLHV
jgi:hypothetical protein